MTNGIVTGIWIAPIAGAPMTAIPRAIVEAERGISGDRYHAGEGSFSRWKGTGRAVTFIARESLEAIFEEHSLDFRNGLTRRNIETEGVDLTDLLGRSFRLGSATFRASRPCQPCKYIERFIGKGAFDALLHRGGIRADVVTPGEFSTGDIFEPFGPKTCLP